MAFTDKTSDELDLNKENTRLEKALKDAVELNEWYEKRCQWYQKELQNYKDAYDHHGPA